jgi:hypothetical protein
MITCGMKPFVGSPRHMLYVIFGPEVPMKSCALLLPKTRHLRLTILVAILTCSPLAERRADAASVEVQEKAARKACLAGDYPAGVAILADLFVETKNPTYVFNQARCFEQNGRNVEAINRFREYLRIAPNLDADIKASVNQHITDCQALGKPQPDPSASSGVGPTTRATDTAPPSVSTTAGDAPRPRPDPVQVLAGPVDQGASDARLRTAGLIVAAAGGAFVMTGVILNLKANALTNDLASAGAYSRQTESKRADFETFAKIGYGIGGACLAGGTLLYILGWRHGPRQDTQVALLPAFGPDGVTAILKGTFQ